MSRKIIATTTLTLILTACGTAKPSASAVMAEHTPASSILNPEWQMVGSSYATGGSFGGIANFSYNFNSAIADELAVIYPVNCGALGVAAKVVAPGQLLTPTHLSAQEVQSGYMVSYFAVNGNGWATLSGAVINVSLSAGAACSPIQTFIHPPVQRRLGNGPAQFGEDCGGAVQAPNMPRQCAAGLSCRNEANDPTHGGTCQL